MPIRQACDELPVVSHLLATGLRRAIARRHGWNESLLAHATQVCVATGNQTRMSPNAPRLGATETAS